MAKKTKWVEAAKCPNCGEAAHVVSCPKPDSIPAAKWRKMSDDERIEAEKKAAESQQKVMAQFTGKKEPVVHFRNMPSLQNGSFHRVWPDGRIFQYMNGDNMGAVKEVPKDCVEQLSQSGANKFLPGCCQIK